MIIAMFSDTHIKIFKKNSSFYDKHIQPSLDFFYDECKRRKVGMIGHLGDFFHVKDTVATEALTKTYRFVDKISRLAPNYYLVGNHDSYMKDNHTIHLLETFKPLATVVDTNYQMFDIGEFRFHFMPYVKEEEIKDCLQKIVYLGNNKDFFFGHFGLNGFIMQQDNYTDQYSTITKNMFSKFKRAFFGHFHFHQQQANCMYISSPFQSRHGDEQGQHGFVFYDTDTDTVEFVSNPHSPEFKTVELNKENLNVLLNYKNHFLRIFHHPALNHNVLVRLKEKLMENNYDVKFRKMEIDESKQEFTIPVIQEWQEIVHKDADEILLEWFRGNKNIIPYSEKEMFAIFK